MQILFTYIVSIIMLFLSILNLFWGLGINFLNNISIIFIDEDVKINRKITHFLAFVILLLFAVIVLIAGDVIHFYDKNYLFRFGSIGIAFSFLARAFGDRKKTGILKKIKDTEEAKIDSYVAIPLCVLVFILIFAINLL